MSTPAPEFQWVDLDEARRITTLSDRYLRDAIKGGKLPARKVGRSLRIELADLIAWCRSLPAAETTKPAAA